MILAASHDIKRFIISVPDEYGRFNVLPCMNPEIPTLVGFVLLELEDHENPNASQIPICSLGILKLPRGHSPVL